MTRSKKKSYCDLNTEISPILFSYTTSLAGLMSVQDSTHGLLAVVILVELPFHCHATAFKVKVSTKNLASVKFLIMGSSMLCRRKNIIQVWENVQVLRELKRTFCIFCTGEENLLKSLKFLNFLQNKVRSDVFQDDILISQHY